GFVSRVSRVDVCFQVVRAEVLGSNSARRECLGAAKMTSQWVWAFRSRVYIRGRELVLVDRRTAAPCPPLVLVLGVITLEIAGDHRTQLARLQRLTNEPLDSGSYKLHWVNSVCVTGI